MVRSLHILCKTDTLPLLGIHKCVSMTWGVLCGAPDDLFDGPFARTVERCAEPKDGVFAHDPPQYRIADCSGAHRLDVFG